MKKYFVPLLVLLICLCGMGVTLMAQTSSEVDHLRAELEAVIGDANIGLDFGRMNPDGSVDFRIGVNNEVIMPVASSFKGFATLYYFLYNPRYVDGTQTEAWQYGEGDPVYSMTVYSNNTKTGVVLAQTAQVNGWQNPIVSFNDFMSLQMGLDMGLYSWGWEGSPTVGYTDERFAPNDSRAVTVGQATEYVSNVATASQIADGWWFFAQAEHNPLWNESPLFRAAITRSRTLLSIPATGYPAPAESSIYDYHYGKEGSLPEGDLPNLGRVLNEGFVVPRADGSAYIVSLTSVGSGEYEVVPVFETITRMIREYDQYLNPNLVADLSGESAAPIPGVYNYGYVRPARINLYSAPSETATLIENPIRTNSTLGTAWVMQGAMLRLSIVDSNWAKIELDRSTDSTYSGMDVFVRLSDVQLIDPSNFEAISSVTGNTNKFIILDITNRTLTLFEGEVAIFKTPVVLNTDSTPRGSLYVNANVISRNMPNHPGVPWDALLSDGNGLEDIGYYIHGSPWHRWSQTVTEIEPLRRYSHGCINVPDWLLDIHGYNIRPDQFIWRWVGGFPNWQTDTLYHVTGNPVRVYALDNVEAQVWDYPSPSGTSWTNVITAWNGKVVDAPEYYFTGMS